MIILATFSGLLNGVTRSWKKGLEVGKATFEFDPDLLTDEDIRRLGQHTGMEIRVILTTMQTSFDAESGELEIALQREGV